MYFLLKTIIPINYIVVDYVIDITIIHVVTWI